MSELDRFINGSDQQQPGKQESPKPADGLPENPVITDLPSNTAGSKNIVWKTMQRIFDFFSPGPQGDYFYNALKINNTNSYAYLYDQKKFKIPPEVLTAVAVAISIGINQHVGKYSVDHEVANYTTERLSILYNQVAATLGALLLSLELVLDPLDAYAHGLFNQDLEKAKGANDPAVIKSKSERKSKIYQNIISTGVLGTSLALFPDKAGIIIGAGLLYEFVVEKWKYGTHVFVHLRDLHKRHGYSIPLLLAAMAGLLGKNIPEDFTRLSQSSINLETMAEKAQPAYQLNTEVAGNMGTDVYYQYVLDRNKKGEPVSKWVALSGTKLAAAQNILGNSAYASTLITRDVVSEENGKTVYLYSLETPTGHTRRILSTKSYSDHDIHNLTAQDRTIYNIPESVYKLENNQVPRGNEISHFIAIPNDEIALILQ